MKLEISNFQSIENCKIEIPERAFTCLVGPTNIGKSAIRRALECVLYNKGDSNYIRNGAKECTVSLILDDGTSIKWSRDKKTAYYEINGESFAKLSGSVPDILIEKGFRELSLSKEKLSVQVAHQFENMFLLNQSGSKITEVLSNLGNLNRIIEANKFCVSDKKNIRSKIKIREEDNDLEKQKINSFLGIDDQKQKVSNLKKVLEDIKNKTNSKHKIIKILDKYQKSSKTFEYLKEIKNVQLIENNIDVDKFKKVNYLYKKFFISLNKTKNFKELSDIKETSFNISEDFEKFKKAKQFYTSLVNKKIKIQFLSDIPKEIDSLDINFDNYNNVKKLYNKIDIVKNNILKYRVEVKDTENNLEKIMEEYEAVKKELKICPLCDSSLI
jgi:DNA repair ATPase RecN